jgi:hypothetical protein
MLAAATFAAALCAAAPSAAARESADAPDGLARFEQAVNAYVALRDVVEESVPPLEMTLDPEEIRHAVDEMADAIRAARAGAKEGDLFNPDAATELRRIIRSAVREPGCQIADITAGARETWMDEPMPTPSRPLVHDRFDWTAGSFMPFCVLLVLPVVRGELEYRFVDRDLVLVDTHADLVLDVLPDALPASESWKGVRYARTCAPDRQHSSVMKLVVSRGTTNS